MCLLHQKGKAMFGAFLGVGSPLKGGDNIRFPELFYGAGLWVGCPLPVTPKALPKRPELPKELRSGSSELIGPGLNLQTVWENQLSQQVWTCPQWSWHCERPVVSACLCVCLMCVCVCAWHLCLFACPNRPAMVWGLTCLRIAQVPWFCGLLGGNFSRPPPGFLPRS